MDTLKLPRIAFALLCLLAVYVLFRKEPWAILETARNMDKLAHFVLFFALACGSGLVFLTLNPVVAQLPLLFLAGFSEWYQEAYLPQRYFSMGDITADVAGILLGFLFCGVCRRKS